MLEWSLCIATLDRPDVLTITISHALAQSCPPSQIVIVDASDAWETSRDTIIRLVQLHAGIRLDYLHSPTRSSATQRNMGIGICRHDIIFILDDDSFMYSDCAEMLLDIYENDPKKAISAAQATLVETPPPSSVQQRDAVGYVAQKKTGRRGRIGRLRHLLLKGRCGRWFYRRVLMQNMAENFIFYDGMRQYPLPEASVALGAKPLSFMQGCAMSVRREIALLEPFDQALRYYAASEDVDASYRYARHGSVILVPSARIHHFEAASGRIKRKKVIVFHLLNTAFLLRRNAACPEAWRNRYRLILYRRILAEFLKDALSARLDFPQFRGALLARRHWKMVWDCPKDRLDTWYPEFQKEILESIRSR